MPSDDDMFAPPTKGEIRRMKAQARDQEPPDEPPLSSAATVRLPGGPKLSFSNDSQKIIVITMTITGLVALVENIHNHGLAADVAVQKLGGVEIRTDEPGTPLPTVPIEHIIIGTFVAGALLLGMSYFLPEFASGLAIVAMLATVLDRGKPFWEVIGLATTQTPKITGGTQPPSLPPNLSASGGGVGPLSPAGTLPVSSSAAPNPYGSVLA